MELLPIIIKALLAISAVFLIVLIASYLISKFRKGDEEVVTESYPAEKYRYFTNSDSGVQQPNSLNEYYYAADNYEENRIQIANPRYEPFPSNYHSIADKDQIADYCEPESYQNNWVDYEEESYFDNPLRKTSSFNTNAAPNNAGVQYGRMTIINEEPLFKYGWE